MNRARLICIIAAVAGLVPFCALYISSDASGWLVFLSMYGLAAADKQLRDHKGSLIAAWTVIGLHQAVAIFNAYGGTLPGAETDAHTFIVYAQNRDLADIQPAIGVNLYRYFLIALLEMPGGSHSLAVASSPLAFTLTIMLFNRLLGMAGVDRLRALLLLALGLFPNVLIFTSVTLREPWQLLFFVASVYYGLRFRLDPRPLSAVMFALCSLLLALLHQVLIPFALLLAAAVMLWPFKPTSLTRATVTLSAVLIVVTGLVLGGLELMKSGRFPGTGVVVRMADFDSDYFLRIMRGYRRAIEKDNPRTTFGTEVDTSSLAALASSMPELYLSYWFAPPPWRIELATDVPASLMAVFRLVALMLTAVSLVMVPESRRLTGFLLFTFFLMSSAWVLGTTNYGQAIRHQALTEWLLLAGAGIYLDRSRRRPVSPGQQPRPHRDHGNG